MKKILSVILIFLACFGFTAELLDKLSETEFVVKEYSEADEHSEKDKKEKEAKEKITYTIENSCIEFSFTVAQTCNNLSFSEGFVSSPYNPPDLL